LTVSAFNNIDDSSDLVCHSIILEPGNGPSYTCTSTSIRRLCKLVVPTACTAATSPRLCHANTKQMRPFAPMMNIGVSPRPPPTFTTLSMSLSRTPTLTLETEFTWNKCAFPTSTRLKLPKTPCTSPLHTSTSSRYQAHQ
jgi:hypothetical protein